MAMISITGASDDLIEIDGVISEEWNWYPEDSNDRRFIAVSDGTLLSCVYDNDGIWRFQRLIEGKANYQKVDGSVIEDTNDIIELSGDEAFLTWVVMGVDYGFRAPTPR